VNGQVEGFSTWACEVFWGWHDDCQVATRDRMCTRIQFLL
jgi:hypothetical protein